MPNGITHFEIGVIGGAAALAIVAAYTDPPTTRAVLHGTLIGLIITPDLDQESTTFTEHIVRRIPLVGLLFQVSWYGYALLFRHRGLSHHLLAGTLTRVVWTGLVVAVWTLVVLGLLRCWDSVPRDWWTQVAGPLLQHAHVGVLAGWWLQDALHILADRI